MRLLGVDPGERRIGLAVSDPLGTIASPLRVVDCRLTDDPIAEVLEAAQTAGAEGRVVGMPLTLRGEMGPAAQRVAEFVEQLRERSPVPVHVIDERLTSAVAERDMAGAGISAQQRRGTVDKIAAALILQSYLDRRAASAEAIHEDTAPQGAPEQVEE